MDGEITHNVAYSTFGDAFKAAFGLFFILNCTYTKKFAMTLEFIQRYALKIYPDTGSKSKSIPKSKKKLITLINNIAKFEKNDNNK